MKTLMDIAAIAVGQALFAGGVEADQISMLPEPEVAMRVWDGFNEALRVRRIFVENVQPASDRAQVAAALSRFFQPERLVLRGACGRLGLLPTVASRLRHLEIRDPELRRIDGVRACSQLVCLALRGCDSLESNALAALPSGLQALDVSGLRQLRADAVFHIARLPALRALNADGTVFGDAALALLTYGLRLRNWAVQQAGPQQLPPWAATWPALPLRHLQLAGTPVTAAGLPALLDLEELVLLDVRRTGIPPVALRPLQLRFGLQFAQGGVLTSSIRLAARAVVHEDKPLCVCGLPGPGQTELERWAAQGAAVLLAGARE